MNLATLPNLAFAAMVTLIATHCRTGAKKDEEQSTRAPSSETFVSSEDVKPRGSLLPLSAAEVRKEINSESDLYANKPKTTSHGAEDVCVDKVLSTLKVVATGRSAFLSGTIDLGPCVRDSFMQSASSSLPITFDQVSITMRLLLKIDCLSEDVSSLNGKSLQEFNQIWKSGFPCGEFSTLAQSSSQTAFKTTFTVGGKSSTQEQTQAQFTIQTQGDGAGCRFKKEGANMRIVGDCTHLDRTVYKVQKKDGVSEDKEGKENLTKVTTKDVVAPVGGNPPYYSSGSAFFSFNDWSGSLVYADSQRAPTWSAKSGTLSATGVLVPTDQATTTPTTPLSLHEQSRDAVSRLNEIIENLTRTPRAL